MSSNLITTFFLLLLFLPTLNRIYGQERYRSNVIAIESKKLPLKKKDKVTFLHIKNYRDSIFPNDNLFLFKNLTNIAISFPSTWIGKNNQNKIKIDTAKLKKLEKIESLFFEGLVIKAFPSELSYLKNLKHLQIQYTLIDSLPSEIRNFKKLSSLILGANKISYIHPNITQLDSLIELVLYDNNFKEFPKCLLDIPNIETISLVNYPYVGNFSNEINYFDHIQELIIAINKPSLKGIMIDVKKCSEMKELKRYMKQFENHEKIGYDYDIRDCGF